ncbi:MAG: hypothetical protein M3Z26_02210 [Bacteroidota bacterium]|nr:hypothetical protein [Bacteroidota bacterium]
MEPISKKMISEMRDEYEKTIRKTSTENLKKKFSNRPMIQEASSTWVSRKELESLLNDNNANGLRLYYGCHHESTHNDPQKDYHGLHNIILVATKDDVDTENPTVENSKDQLNDIEQKPVAKNEMAVQSYAGSGGDMLPLCPPNCPK